MKLMTDSCQVQTPSNVYTSRIFMRRPALLVMRGLSIKRNYLMLFGNEYRGRFHVDEFGFILG
jgi:hypothetical protein